MKNRDKVLWSVVAFLFVLNVLARIFIDDILDKLL